MIIMLKTVVSATVMVACFFFIEINSGGGREQLERSVKILASEEVNGPGLSAEKRQK